MWKIVTATTIAAMCSRPKNRRAGSFIAAPTSAKNAEVIGLRKM